MRRFIALATLLLAVALAPAAALADVRVAAPGAMSGLVDDIAAAWSASPGGHNIKLAIAYGHSGEQTRAILMGDAPDIFIAAEPELLSQLLSKGLLAKDGVAPLAATQLVLFAAADDREITSVPLDAGLTRYLGDKPLAICDPIAMVAGHYAREALASLNLWDATKNHLLILGHPRAVLRAVDQGDARLGIGYRSDLAHAPRLREVAAFPLSTVPLVVFPAGLLADHERPETRDFFAFLHSSAVSGLLAKHGFALPPGK